MLIVKGKIYELGVIISIVYKQNKCIQFNWEKVDVLILIAHIEISLLMCCAYS